LEHHSTERAIQLHDDAASAALFALLFLLLVLFLLFGSLGDVLRGERLVLRWHPRSPGARKGAELGRHVNNLGHCGIGADKLWRLAATSFAPQGPLVGTLGFGFGFRRFGLGVRFSLLRWLQEPILGERPELLVIDIAEFALLFPLLLLQSSGYSREELLVRWQPRVGLISGYQPWRVPFRLLR